MILEADALERLPGVSVLLGWQKFH
jgi:hypothetical protein